MFHVRDIVSWLGIASPKWLQNAIARRNMPIVMVGSVLMAAFAIMLAFCLITGLPCPIDGFDEAAHETPDVTQRFLVTALVEIVLLIGIIVYSLLYMKKKWNHPHVAAVVTAVFAFLMAAMWGIAESGVPIAQQVLIFASIQFLVAGLLVFNPIGSLLYFAITFSLFGMMMAVSCGITYTDEKNLVYLTGLDVVVSWLVYGLFRRSVFREYAMADKSRRDELTGAKNRHYLRDDFSNYIGSNLLIMLCDIDDFKRYNDSFSHDMGDKLLREFYFALRDAFGDEGTYRYGGDEFLIVVKDFDDEELSRSQKIVRALLAKVSVGDEKNVLTYSGGYKRGVAEDYETFREMLHEADGRLLQAKREGKDRIVGK